MNAPPSSRRETGAIAFAWWNELQGNNAAGIRDPKHQRSVLEREGLELVLRLPHVELFYGLHCNLRWGSPTGQTRMHSKHCATLSL